MNPSHPRDKTATTTAGEKTGFAPRSGGSRVAVFELLFRQAANLRRNMNEAQADNQRP